MNKRVLKKSATLMAVGGFIIIFSLYSGWNPLYLLFLPLMIFNDYLVIQTKAVYIKAKKKEKIEDFGFLTMEMHLALLMMLLANSYFMFHFEVLSKLYISVLLADFLFRMGEAFSYVRMG